VAEDRPEPVPLAVHDLPCAAAARVCPATAGGSARPRPGVLRPSRAVSVAIGPVGERVRAGILQRQLTASQSDPSSNAVVEALSCGLPAVYFHDGGHPELVEFGGIGFRAPEEIPGVPERLVPRTEPSSGISGWTASTSSPRSTSTACAWREFWSEIGAAFTPARGCPLPLTPDRVRWPHALVARCPMTPRSMLPPVLGRERTIWRALPWPRLRHRLFRDDIDCVIFALLVSLRLTFRQLCEKHNVSRLDLLHIDAEGADAEILEQVDFRKYQPSVVLYEHNHLSEGDQENVNQMLDRAGYTCVRIRIDTLAVRRAALTAFPKLAAAWRLTFQL
jgi:hypothetical protein